MTKARLTDLNLTPDLQYCTFEFEGWVAVWITGSLSPKPNRQLQGYISVFWAETANICWRDAGVFWLAVAEEMLGVSKERVACSDDMAGVWLAMHLSLLQGIPSAV